MDFLLLNVRLCYSPPEAFEANRSSVIEKGKASMKQFSDALGSNDFFAGEKQFSVLFAYEIAFLTCCM